MKGNWWARSDVLWKVYDRILCVGVVGSSGCFPERYVFIPNLDRRFREGLSRWNGPFSIQANLQARTNKVTDIYP